MKTTFYKLRQPSEAKVIGVKDGLNQAEFIREGFTNKEHYDNILNFIRQENFQNFGKFPPFEINLECVKMRNDAKLTDFISIHPRIPCGQFLISEKVVKILSTFHLPEYRLYPATIDFNGTIIQNYKLLYIPFIEILDVGIINKSTFYTGWLSNKKYYTFSNTEEYLNFSKNTYTQVDKLYLSSEFDITLDYFELRGSEPFVSEDLRETLEIAGITGIKFVEAKEPELFFEE